MTMVDSFMHWKIAEAKQDLSRLVRAAATEPQWIQNRDVVVAVVIGADQAEAFLDWQKRRDAETLAEALTEVGEIAAMDDYVLEVPARADRPNALTPNVRPRAPRGKRRAR